MRFLLSRYRKSEHKLRQGEQNGISDSLSGPVDGLSWYGDEYKATHWSGEVIQRGAGY